MSPRRLVVPALVAAGLIALWVVEPSVVRSSVRSPRALALVAGVVVASVGLGALARRGPRPALLSPIASALPVALVVWLAVIPAVRDVELDEALPEGFSSAAPMTTASAAPSPGAAATGARLVSMGELTGINHTASGAVSVYRTADGKLLVRFDDVEIKGSPDPQLYLVPGRDKKSRDGGLHVGDLKATKGSFNHVVTDDFDTGGEFTVFIWCGQFAVPIAHAPQPPPNE